MNMILRSPYPPDATDDGREFVSPSLRVMHPVPRGGRCLTSFHGGTPSISKPSVGLVRASSRRWVTVYAFCCAGSRIVPTPRPPRSLTAGPSSVTPGVALGGCDGAQRRTGSKVHLAVDRLGHLLGPHVTPANAQDRKQVGAKAEAVPATNRDAVEVVFVDQGYPGAQPAGDAAVHGIALAVIKLPEAKRGFVLLPQRWIVERSFAWAPRFRRLACIVLPLPV